jgi:hypothetical protein
MIIVNPRWASDGFLFFSSLGLVQQQLEVPMGWQSPLAKQ